MSTLQLSLEPAISGVRQGDCPADAGELDSKHQPGPGTRAVPIQSLLEATITAESDIVTYMVIRRIEVDDVDHLSFQVLTRARR